MSDPDPASSPYTSPATPPAAAANYQTQSDATGGVIPYKNPKALTAYYLGIFSLFPAIGLPLGVASIWLGILGLKARRQNPIIRGHVHAWIGIVLGVLGMPLHLLVGAGCVAAILGA
ncbi:hypothetical protein [Roseimaritima sediminicola]|uniref:hypothetical protein n=1 Tax=Roseimaritima sediminicola TaxID=2662066 RepID=UPI0012984263|nr:hypothetical protein [Roseimaritima sediminicola]